jgi:hypothetical protein
LIQRRYANKNVSCHNWRRNRDNNLASLPYRTTKSSSELPDSKSLNTKAIEVVPRVKGRRNNPRFFPKREKNLTRDRMIASHIPKAMLVMLEKKENERDLKRAEARSSLLPVNIATESLEMETDGITGTR